MHRLCDMLQSLERGLLQGTELGTAQFECFSFFANLHVGFHVFCSDERLPLDICCKDQI